jgi:hypothetical protein
MMDGMVLWGLDEAEILQSSDEPWEFLRRGVSPTVNGVHVHPKQHQEEKLPPEKAQQRSNTKD